MFGMFSFSPTVQKIVCAPERQSLMRLSSLMLPSKMTTRLSRDMEGIRASSLVRDLTYMLNLSSGVVAVSNLLNISRPVFPVAPRKAKWRLVGLCVVFDMLSLNFTNV